VLLTVVLLLALGIESVVTLRFEMAMLLAVLMKTGTLLAVLSVEAGTLLIALSVEAGTLLIALSVEAGTRRAVLSESRLFAFTTETRTRPTLPFIVGIKHVFFQL
jgi:lambda repressor-like predicted transcriptional regulator